MLNIHNYSNDSFTDGVLQVGSMECAEGGGEDHEISMGTKIFKGYLKNICFSTVPYE